MLLIDVLKRSLPLDEAKNGIVINMGRDMFVGENKNEPLTIGSPNLVHRFTPTTLC
jgi:hypothetical protein